MKNEDLLARWEESKRMGVTRSQFAESLGITPKSLDNKLWRAKKRRKRGEDRVNVEYSDVTDGNYRYLISNTDRIKSVDDLIKACSVDLEEWQLDDKYEIGSWEMGRRAEQKNLKWSGGKIVEGQAEDTGKLWIETLYRVRATLVRKKPKPIHPLVQPVSFTLPSLPERNQETASGKALIVPDSQTGFRRDFKSGKLTPFHDRRAHDIILQVAACDSFDTVIYIGDGLDFTEFSDKFVLEPEFYYTTQPAIIEYAWFLAQMVHRKPDARHMMLLGNHEARLDAQFHKHLYAACQLRPSTEIELDEPYSIRRLLGLDSMGIVLSDKYPNGEYWLSEHARCVHDEGVSSNPGGTVSKMIRDITETTLAGHNHRLEMATKTVDDCNGIRYVTAATCGCLCHIDYRVPGHNKGHSWQQGFAVLHYAQKSPSVDLITISDGEAVYNGRRFVGEDYVDLLSESTEWDYRG